MLFRNSFKSFPCKIFGFRTALARLSTSTAAPGHASSLEFIHKQVTTAHPRNNIPESIIPKIGRKLHLQKDHPLNVVKKRIEDYCQAFAERKYKKLPNTESRRFDIYDSLPPVVDTKSCFDDLLVQADHVSRRPSDTYYINDNLLLRTHTSAHQCQLISSGSHMFLCSGDVFRRDEIDASHYPVFHQMEGVKVFDSSEFPPGDLKTKEFIEADLKELLTGLALHLFGNVEMRWNSDYFPFTNPSFELEVNFNGEWLEVLGCGVIHDKVMENAGKGGMQGWAFGLGLERLAMVLFKIPDIRLFWTSDDRFHNQFTGLSESPHKSVSFVSYSKYPSCYKDVSFWLPQNPGETGSSLHMNDIFEVIRNVAGDLVERVDLFDEFTHKKTGRVSHAYRITFRHMDRSLTNSEVDDVQFKLRESLVKSLKVELR